MDPTQELKECAGTFVKLETKKKGKYREEIGDYGHRKETWIYFTVLFRGHSNSPNAEQRTETTILEATRPNPPKTRHPINWSVPRTRVQQRTREEFRDL